MDFIKAPWRYEVEIGCIRGGKSDALICDMLPTGDKVHEANAALIAAAPEMYEMLSLLLTNSTFNVEHPVFAEEIEKLLAKAGGEK